MIRRPSPSDEKTQGAAGRRAPPRGPACNKKHELRWGWEPLLPLLFMDGDRDGDGDGSHEHRWDLWIIMLHPPQKWYLEVVILPTIDIYVLKVSLLLMATMHNDRIKP